MVKLHRGDISEVVKFTVVYCDNRLIYNVLKMNILLAVLAVRN